MSDQENPDSQPAAASDDKPKIRFDTSKIYLKDASFEVPGAPEVFFSPLETPLTNADISIQNTLLNAERGIYEVVLVITIDAQVDEKTVYLAEVQQAGIFLIQHPQQDAVDTLINVTCPHILLPFIREELNGLITKGGFNAFMLTPINFEALYRNKLAKDRQARDEDAGDESGGETPTIN